MVCKPCKSEGQVRPWKQWEVTLRGDVTVLPTPRVFPMPHQRVSVDWMNFKECLLSTQSTPTLVTIGRDSSGTRLNLPVSGRDSWLPLVALFLACWLSVSGQSSAASLHARARHSLLPVAKQCIKYCCSTWSWCAPFPWGTTLYLKPWPREEAVQSCQAWD